MYKKIIDYKQLELLWKKYSELQLRKAIMNDDSYGIRHWCHEYFGEFNPDKAMRGSDNS